MPRSFLPAFVLGVALLVGLGPLPGCAQDRGGASRDGTSAPTADSAQSKDVPYVTTPQRVVERMLAMADVSAGDVVYDLGSGDGRFVITAAQQFGARGVGVEIDPELVREARAQARLAGVADRVTFRQGNLFDVDLREATVVTLYLEPDLNLRLRPKLLLQLDPGDRVVSHDFGMGSWTPDRVEKMDGSTLYLWTVPSQLPDSLGP
jgi:SAM-dependent methyltransferase